MPIARTQEKETAASGGSPTAKLLRLENPWVAAEIDPQNGGVRSIRDKAQGISYQVPGISFAITSEGGTLRGDKALSLKQNREGLELRFGGNGLDVALHYRLRPDDRFIEKWVEIKASDGKPYFLKEVMLEDVSAAAPFSEIHFHDDQTIWQCPINLFLRGEKGGCFAGLEYPYWDMELRGKDGFRLGYKPNYQAKAGEVNVSEKYFLGVYRREGIVRYSHGPYPRTTPAALVTWKDTGLFQHFKDGKVHADAIAPEVLDWGEVWAMQDFMRQLLPDFPLPEKGYWVWQNGWWANLFVPKNEILDRLKAAGIHDVMTAHTWYGRGNHPSPEPYLSQMRPDPLGFPKDKGVAGLPGEAGPAVGLHAKHDVFVDQFVPDEFTPDFRAPAVMEPFIKYGREIGVHVSSFSLPGIWFEQKPEWGSVNENGKPTVYIWGRKVACPACDEYMQHMLALHQSVFAKYEPRWWGWDGRWMSHWEVPKYRPGPKGAGLDPCFAKNHGHLPGDDYYKEWKNIQGFLAELRRRFPQMCLEEYCGLKRGGPWALQHLSADDNYYETNGADMNRLQTWHNENDRFRPVYKNYAAIFGNNAKSFQFNVISTISTTAYCQIGPGYAGLAQPENQEFLKKWRAWATENHAYLKVKRNLFECPGYAPIDGSAHVLKDRGFLFLFPGGFDIGKKHDKTLRASIPLTRWIGLEEKAGATYKLVEVYPREGRVLATCRYGETLLYDMPDNSAVILALTPAAPGETIESASFDPKADKVEGVPAFSETFPEFPKPNDRKN